MPINLKNKNVLVTGGSRGLGAVICEKFAQEGCNVAINYASLEEPALALAKKLEGEYNVKAIVIKADAGILEDCARCVQLTIKAFGGIDVIIGNAGWTRFSAFGDLHAMSEEEWDKCWAINVKGQMAVLREALPTFNNNKDGGSFIITSSIAGVTAAGSSMPYSVTKAAGLRLMKNLAATQGPKVRVNAVLPGLLLTEWGQKFPKDTITSLKEAAALKDVTDLDDCADAFIMLAKNGSMTGMKIQVDAGLKVDTP